MVMVKGYFVVVGPSTHPPISSLFSSSPFEGKQWLYV